MKKLLLLLGTSLGATGLLAFAPHPSVLTVKYQDQMLPVVKVIETDPVVMVDGQEKRIRTQPIYLLQRTDGYGEGYVETKRASLAGVTITTVPTAQDGLSAEAGYGRSPGGTSYFEGLFKPRTSLTGGFIVICIYSRLSFSAPSADNHPAIIVHDLPSLPAGDFTAVKVSSDMFDRLPNQSYFIQVFDGTGREIQTDCMESAWEYYSLRDRAQLTGVIGKYLEKFKGADHAAVPAVMARPVFKGGTPTTITAATAVLAVSAEGLVTDVRVSGVDDAAARQSIVNALGGWLFLPQLKAGRPVATKIQVPLQF